MIILALQNNYVNTVSGVVDINFSLPVLNKPRQKNAMIRITGMAKNENKAAPNTARPGRLFRQNWQKFTGKIGACAFMHSFIEN